MPIPFFSEKLLRITEGNDQIAFMASQYKPQIVISCVSIKHQLSLAKIGDFSEKNGMGISPDPLRGALYNL